MGCDIHTNVEYRKPTINGPVWTDGNKYESNHYFGDPNEPEFKEINEICGNRNYSLFAVLADVRNSNGVKPLSKPRGLPKDCCETIALEHKSWGSDAHSTSYFTLAELIKALPTYPILQNLVNDLTKRYEELLPQNAPLVTKNDIRFIFWFDN